MKYYNLVLGIMTFVIMSCSGSKTVVTQAQIDALDELVQNGQLRIESDWAYPQVTTAVQQVLSSGLQPIGSTAGAINLIGNPNFLSISGDSISSYLPYFGERRMNVDYSGRDGAIQLDGTLKDYKVEKVKRNSYQITFLSKSKSESFNISIKLHPNLNSEMVLNGTSRTTIRYTGKVVPYTTE